jgi:hypothetical protein
VDFLETLGRLGFVQAEERSTRGTTLYRADPSAFLTYWVHAYEDGTALFTWEFAIVDYLARHGIQLGSGEALNTFMFPAQDERGRQDGGWLTAAVDRAEAALSSLRFGNPAG